MTIAEETVSEPRALSLLEAYRSVRRLSMELVAPLDAEEMRIQSMPDVSPPWWNLGHTTWFFAKNVLEPLTGYRFPEPGYEYALNSYYEAHGERVPRERRGDLSRPTTGEILELRADVDRRMEELLGERADDQRLAFLVRTGLEHEQQHQELLVTEIKHIRWSNPPDLRKPYSAAGATDGAAGGADAPALGAIEVEGGLREIGTGGDAWCWDNETPRHRVFVEPFALADRLVTVGELREFVADGGYRQPLLWLANGWETAQREGWRHPLYWHERDGEWLHWTLRGTVPLADAEPAAHLSFYEAHAYATWRSENDAAWKHARLPTEAEWEVAALELGFDPERGNLLGASPADRFLHPRPSAGTGLRQMAGDLWEWTSSHYEPYPGYRPFDGELMEYNGKFMDNQRVLRGGSCATPREHLRPTYRNFWHPATRFQFTGLRLVRD